MLLDAPIPICNFSRQFEPFGSIRTHNTAFWDILEPFWAIFAHFCGNLGSPGTNFGCPKFTFWSHQVGLDVPGITIVTLALSPLSHWFKLIAVLVVIRSDLCYQYCELPRQILLFIWSKIMFFRLVSASLGQKWTFLRTVFRKPVKVALKGGWHFLPTI